MRYQAVLFDFDGVALKSMEQHYEAWSSAFAEHGKRIGREEFYMQEGQGIGTIASNLGKRLGLSPVEIQNVIENKSMYFKQLQKVELYDNFIGLLEEMNRRNISMGVVTGGNKARVKPIFDEYFNGYFKCLVTIEDVEQGKPFPEPYLKGAALLGVEPGSCVVVENAPLGIQAGRAAGMFVIAVETTLPAKYLSEADYIARDFIEVKRKMISLI